MTFIKIGEIIADMKIKYTYKINGQLLERTYRIEDIEQGVAKCDPGEVIVKRELIRKGAPNLQTIEEEIREVRGDSKIQDIVVPAQ